MQDKMALTIPETAEALSVSRQTVYRFMRDDPSFPIFKIGRSVRISMAGLQRWVNEQTGAVPGDETSVREKNAVCGGKSTTYSNGFEAIRKGARE